MRTRDSRSSALGAASLGLLVGSAWLSGCIADSRSKFMYVVEPDAFVRELDTLAPIVLDARPKPDFETARVRGAVWVDLANWVAAAKTEEDALSQRALWGQRVGRLGVGADDYVVVVDDGRLTEAARVWFILQYLGVNRSAILNGGYPAVATRLPVAVVDHGPAEPPVPKTFAAPTNRASPVALRQKNDLRSTITARSATIVDVRTPAEFSGEDRRKNPRGGHLPHAVNLPHRALLTPENQLKPPAELRKLFAQAGLAPESSIIVHCESGGRSSLAALAAIEAGYKSVGNYYLSFSEWAADERCPVVLPPGSTQPAAAR